MPPCYVPEGDSPLSLEEEEEEEEEEEGLFKADAVRRRKVFQRFLTQRRRCEMPAFESRGGEVRWVRKGLGSEGGGGRFRDK